MFCIVIVNEFREKTKTNNVVVCHQIQKRSLTPSGVPHGTLFQNGLFSSEYGETYSFDMNPVNLNDRQNVDKVAVCREDGKTPFTFV